MCFCTIDLRGEVFYDLCPGYRVFMMKLRNNTASRLQRRWAVHHHAQRFGGVKLNMRPRGKWNGPTPEKSAHKLDFDEHMLPPSYSKTHGTCWVKDSSFILLNCRGVFDYNVCILQHQFGAILKTALRTGIKHDAPIGMWQPSTTCTMRSETRYLLSV